MKIVPNKFWWEYTKGNKVDGSYWTLRSNNNVLEDTSVVIQTVNKYHRKISSNKDVRSGCHDIQEGRKIGRPASFEKHFGKIRDY